MSPPLVPILSQFNPVQSTPSYLSRIHFYIIYACIFWSSYWYIFTSGFPTNILHACLFSPFVLPVCSAHSSWLHHSNYTWWRVQVMGLWLQYFTFCLNHFWHYVVTYTFCTSH
jgi:hypothetical protein